MTNTTKVVDAIQNVTVGDLQATALHILFFIGCGVLIGVVFHVVLFLVFLLKRRKR